MNSVKNFFSYQATRGTELLADFIEWITESGIQVVAESTGKHLKEIEKYQRVWDRLEHHVIQAAARKAQLSFTVVLDLGTAVYPLRGRKDRHELIAKLCRMLRGRTADEALALMRTMIKKWIGDTTKRRDTACMHKRVGQDGKRRFVAALGAPIAARIDTILHKQAVEILKQQPQLQYDEAYAQAFIQKITTPHSGEKELFGPMFMIATNHHFHSDCTISTTDGALVDIQDVVDEKIAPAGWAAVTGTTDDSPVIPLVGAFVKVHRRFASQPQRLAAIMETLVCAWPGCQVAASKCQIHHIQPYQHGGQTTGLNLTPLCKKHNGENDDHPGQQVHGRIERDTQTGRPGLRRRPGQPLEFNHHPVTAKTITVHKAL